MRDCKTIISDYQVQLHHVGGKENPADFLTKSFSIKFDSCSLWLNEPQFLIGGGEWTVFKETPERENEKHAPVSEIYASTVLLDNPSWLPRATNFSNFHILLASTYITEQAILARKKGTFVKPPF